MRLLKYWSNLMLEGEDVDDNGYSVNIVHSNP